ncbi:MAG TPA: hypothetical protein VIV11_12430 [Kofleriaceae bacterium]
MRTMWILIALAGCVAHDGPPAPGDTLGSGTLEQVTWSGGLCQRKWPCVGTLELGPAGFQARYIDNNELVAAGQLATETQHDLDAFVAAIPRSEPTGTYEEDGLDGAVWEYRVRVDDETRLYLTKRSFQNEFGLYVFDLKDTIASCISGSYVASYASCTPSI